MSILVKKEEVTELIPQKEPFVMIGNLLKCDDASSRTDFYIDETNILCKNGRFSEAGLIENLAQTGAVRIGYLSKLLNKPVPLGFIGAIKNLKIYELPLCGTTIETEMRVADEIFGFNIAHGEIKQGDKQIAECEMKIFIQNR